MKRFFAFIRKEFKHILRDPRTLTILIGMPVVQLLLFGFAITNEIRDAHTAILDNSKDHITKQIIDKILSSGYYLLDTYLTDDSEIEAEFRKGHIKLCIIFESNFAENLIKTGTANVQIITDATDPNTANTLISYTTNIIQDFNFDLSSQLLSGFIIKPEIRFRYNTELKGAYLFVPGIITTLMMLISAMMTSISITREKELGTMEILLASPMKPAQVIIAKVVPYLILSLIISTIVLFCGHFVFGVPIVGSLILLFSELTLFVITSLSVGIMISTFTSSQQVALLISLMGLMLPTILLSGFIFPIENMPIPLQYLTMIIPARWFLIIIRSIMLKGVGIEVVWKETIILASFLIFYILISIKKYKIRLEN